MVTFGTKAETLDRIKTQIQSCVVPDMMFFTSQEWRHDHGGICRKVKDYFRDCPVAIRSSACNEDSAVHSMAGAYRSVLDVRSSDLEAIRSAVEEVLSSYKSGNGHDQVLIQNMVSPVAMSGVIMTHDLTNGAPYYIINYDDESGRTDTITGGKGVNKTVVIHHDAVSAYIESPRIASLLGFIRELEHVCGGREPLDIEFAQTQDGKVHLLQLRRIAVRKNWNRAVRTRLSEALEHISQFFESQSRQRNSLAGKTTVLGQMPDWNPAELIGTRPSPLAVSLFRKLITDSTWQEARASMGYKAVPEEPLMVLLAGRPYIDVRNSFNSFLPSGLDPSIENSLIDAWLHRLSSHPEFHDKVEFEVAQTVMDFAFESNFGDRYAGVLASKERREYSDRLQELTVKNVSVSPGSSLSSALQLVRQLENGTLARQTNSPPLRRALSLIDECRRYGTLNFSIIARHAFIAEMLLRSAIQKGVWTTERLEGFKRSLTTVAKELGLDFAGVMKGELSREAFMGRYGHLRPGTFDLLSPRYDQRDDLFDSGSLSADSAVAESHSFILSSAEQAGFASLLRQTGLPISVEELLLYAKTAMAGREYAKFVFTRHLSDALEQIAEWGENIGLTREDLSYLNLHDLSQLLVIPVTSDHETHFHTLAEHRRTYLREMHGLHLGYIIRDVRDIYVVPLHRSAANFVTKQNIEGEVVLISNRMIGSTNLYRKIVCIESADPGFDWIFTKGIKGLVTKFGGANSHMTIRCAELGIPAAIGVGEQTFERLSKVTQIELRCSEKLVRPLHG